MVQDEFIILNLIKDYFICLYELFLDARDRLGQQILGMLKDKKNNNKRVNRFDN